MKCTVLVDALSTRRCRAVRHVLRVHLLLYSYEVYSKKVQNRWLGWLAKSSGLFRVWRNWDMEDASWWGQIMQFQVPVLRLVRTDRIKYTN